MTQSSPAPRATTPDGSNGVILHWPQSGHFRVLRDGGREVDYVSVTPVLLDSGEVRFYDTDVLDRA